MTVSSLEFYKEKARQAKTQDFNFLKRLLYFFELVVPPQAGGSGDKTSFLFPLILPPEFISLTEPYTVEVTPTQGGGLYVEENGIVQRDLIIKGHTGFKPRMLRTDSASSTSNPIKSAASASLGALTDLGTTVGLPYIQPVESKSYSRKLPKNVVAAISGQRHFQYLQDAVFRTYADLKKDPATAMDTTLKFHNPKDDEHWEVIPRKFMLERDKARRFLYTYTIDLLVVGPADPAGFGYSEDKTLLDQFKDKLGVVKKGLDLVNGSINDLTRLAGELRTSVSNIDVIIDSANRIKSNVQDFVDGTNTLIESSHKTLKNLVDSVDMSLLSASVLARAGATSEVPETPANTMRQLNKGLELIGANPELFAERTNDESIAVKNQQNKSKIFTEDEISSAKDATTPSTYNGLDALGSGLSPGEAIAIGGEIDVNGDIDSFTSTRKVSISKGDTLLSLAARYMGDARLWQYIAIANSLRPPFVDDIASIDISRSGDESPFGDALGVGSYVNIPTNNASTVSYPLLPILGTELSESIENHLLGVDFALDPIFNTLDEVRVPFSNRVQYDIPINVEKGSMDVKIVEGLSNIKQSIILRIVTERGSVILFKNFGLSPIIGSGFTLSDLENVKYRIREAVLSDPRLGNIERLELTQEKDALISDMDISLRGFSEMKTLQAMLG